LTRFAWAIFPLLADFLTSECDAGTTTATKQATADENYALANANSSQPPQSRSNSHRKRKALDSTVDDNGDDSDDEKISGLEETHSENSKIHPPLLNASG
jgi:hypothetical protein